MVSISQMLNFFINRCPSCGLSATTICARCWYILNEVGSPQKGQSTGLHLIGTEPFTQRALYLWDDRVARPAGVLRDALLASKETPAPEMIRMWAAELSSRAFFDGSLGGKRDWLVVPPPGRSGYGENDHAGALAEALAVANRNHLIAEVEILERVGESRRMKRTSFKTALHRTVSQKVKSRAERSDIEFRVSPIAKNRIRQARGFIFIDDVIATGATARAAWIALGKPRAFESWAIAYKVRENAVTFKPESAKLPL